MYSGFKQLERFTLTAALALGLIGITGPAQTVWASTNTSQNSTQSFNSSSGQFQSKSTIQEAQRCLRDDGYYSGSLNGKLNSKTRAAIRSFQQDHGLAQTGSLTPRTMAALRAPIYGTASRSSENQNSPSTSSSNTGSMASGNTMMGQFQSPATLRHAQRLLQAEGYYTGSIDGIDGPATQSALRNFQRDYGLRVTGRLTPRTLSTLGVTPPSGQSSLQGPEYMQMRATATIRDAQRLLRSDGYYSGPVDGVDGPGTHAAIRRFQRDNGLAVTGRLTPRTLSTLGVPNSGEASRSASLNSSSNSANGSSNQSAMRMQSNRNGAMNSEQSGNNSANREDMSGGMNTQQLGVSSSVIIEAQRNLQQQGIYSGAINGVLGPQTRDAIRKYQRLNNLTDNGQLDQQTLSSLGID
jgi:peptidoglycan hydrolase-like protein with peptidoglycan-binding domain